MNVHTYLMYRDSEGIKPFGTACKQKSRSPPEYIPTRGSDVICFITWEKTAQTG